MLSFKFQLGNLILPSNVFYSPLAGCSDYPFRLMAARYKPGLMFCEMVKMQALLRANEETLNYLSYCEEMRPIGAQIVGSDPKLAGPAAKIIEDRGFDVVDYNCGCPVDKVTKDGSGSGMLRQPERIGEVIAQMRAAVSIPVTVKIRAGWDFDSINASKIVEIAEEAGADMISIHGRTRSQGYRGTADRDVIRDAKQAAKKIKVCGNGDIFDGPSAEHMFTHTQCDAILCSRGTFGKPWLADEIYRYMQGEAPKERDPLEVLFDHIETICKYRPPRKAVVDIRRVGCWYCKSAPNISQLRSKLSRVSSVEEAKRHVLDFAQEV